MMVRLYTSLLVIALVTGSALASSREYQRRAIDAQSSKLSSIRLGHAAALQSREFVDKEDLFVRDLDAFDEVEARAFKFPVGSVKLPAGAGKAAIHYLGKAIDLAGSAGTAYTIASTVNGAVSPQASQAVQHSRRDLEDNEDLFERDLDHEELLGREYALDERDTIDNEDLFVRDLDTEELFEREYDLLDERDIIDYEDLVRVARDLEAEELFGREYYYDLLDEQY